MKDARHEKISSLIAAKKIETQEELAEALRAEGVNVTQATVSRDIKDLMLLKVPDAQGRYYYTFPEQQQLLMPPERLERTFADAIIGIRASGLLAIVRTLPGAAQAVAYGIDYIKWPEVLGTIAGDDTIFVALDQEINMHVFMKRFPKKRV